LEFTKRTGLSVFEASAKTGSGVESSFIALTDALIDQAVKNGNNKKKTETKSKKQAEDNSKDINNPYYKADDSDTPYDEKRIKMKRINGKGISQQDRAMMYCC
jgi:flagellar hook-length control protein FliK